jgi:hypothetical protein
MRAIIALTCMLLSSSLLASTVRHRNLPERLWGTWAPSADRCRDNKSTVVVSETGYVTEQTRCQVHWVIETAGRSALIYSVHMRCSSFAAPEQMTELTRIIVPNDSSQLSTGLDFKELKTYHRCPAE